MEAIYYLLPVLMIACPIMMGAMMWLMMRGSNGAEQPSAATQSEVAALRAEVEALRTAANRDTTGKTA
jgi:hypothetical protein